MQTRLQVYFKLVIEAIDYTKNSLVMEPIDNTSN